jgi:hypothetical protein
MRRRLGEEPIEAELMRDLEKEEQYLRASPGEKRAVRIALLQAVRELYQQGSRWPEAERNFKAESVSLYESELGALTIIRDILGLPLDRSSTGRAGMAQPWRPRATGSDIEMCG